MSDFEDKLQRWMLVMVVIIGIVVAAMNYWYKVLPERAALERSAKSQPQRRPSKAAPVASNIPASIPALSQPVVPVPQEQAPPRKVDLELKLTLPDGRILGFEKIPPPPNRAEIWSSTDIVNPWLLVPDTLDRSDFPPIPSQRAQFIPLLLADGRLALIGGMTPRFVVALDKDCTECRDEYLPFGDAAPSTSTDILDLETGTWSYGPVAAHTADTAIRLRDGRVFKLGTEQEVVEQELHTRLFIEVSDDNFTRWQRAGEVHAGVNLSGAAAFESRTGVVLLFQSPDGNRAFHWTPNGRLKPWLEDESWQTAEQLDEGHLQLTRRIDTLRPSTVKKIVELP